MDAAKALAEDRADEDLLRGLAGDRPANAAVLAKSAGVLAGAPWFEACIAHCVGRAAHRCVWLLGEGESFTAGDILAQVCAPADALLAAERTALNFLQMLCAVAAQARAISEAARPVPVYDTRKTVPLLRAAQKYAAALGGMRANRPDLHAAAIVKDNHVRAAGSVGAAYVRARELCAVELIQIEVACLAELNEALAVGAERIMLDNFSPAQARAAVAACKGRAELEASGGIGAHNAAQYAAAGVDRISCGTATKAAGAVDLSLQFS